MCPTALRRRNTRAISRRVQAGSSNTRPLSGQKHTFPETREGPRWLVYLTWTTPPISTRIRKSCLRKACNCACRTLDRAGTDRDVAPTRATPDGVVMYLSKRCQFRPIGRPSTDYSAWRSNRKWGKPSNGGATANRLDDWRTKNPGRRQYEAKPSNGGA